MKHLLLAGLLCLPSIAFSEFKSPIRNICSAPAKGGLTNSETAQELLQSCSLHARSSSQKISNLSKSVLDVLEHMKGEDRWADNPQVRSAVAELTDALNEAMIPQPSSLDRGLKKDIGSLARNFSTVESRSKNRAKYYQELKNIIAQTSEGDRLIRCFENNPDSRVLLHEVEFLEKGKRRAGNDESAHLDIFLVEGDPLKRKKLVLVLDLRTNPLAAISMVAHEMQHACNANTMCDHFDECEFGSNCADYNEAVVVDELVSHNLEARFFSELAQAAPELMCNYTMMYGGERRPKRLADFHAENQEKYNQGTLLQSLAPSYIRSGNWPKSAVYSATGEINSSLATKIRKAGVPLSAQ